MIEKKGRRLILDLTQMKVHPIYSVLYKLILFSCTSAVEVGSKCLKMYVSKIYKETGVEVD